MAAGTSFLSAVMPVAGSQAGECIDSAEQYLEYLDTGFADSRYSYGLSCLTDIPIEFSHRWAGPIAAKAFAEARRDTLRPRVAAVIGKLRKSAPADTGIHRLDLCRLAARYGIASIDSIDVYRELVAGIDGTFTYDYFLLAILADERTPKFLSARYWAIRSGSTNYEGEIDDVVCCLYHVPGPDAVALARDLMRTEVDAGLKARLQRVVDRPRDQAGQSGTRN